LLANGFDCGFRALFVLDVVDGNGRSAGRQAFSDGASDAARTAGHDRGFSLELQGHDRLL